MKTTRLGDRSFKFQAAWMLHTEFLKWMQKAWSWDGNLITPLKNSVEKLQAWNRSTFGNIFKRKKRNQMRLEGVTRALEVKMTFGLLRLDEKLKKERSEVLLQEELLWLQKSRANWLRFGDKNMRFFHTSTMIQRRRNKVEALKNELGEWCMMVRG